MEITEKGLNCFISYSHNDSKMCDKFKTHLKYLEKLYNINCWYDGKIPVGGNIDKYVLTNLKKSDIIILLISPSYLSSYYCYDKELKIAIDKQKRDECVVIPVILHDFVRDNYPFSGLKYVPTDGKPIDKFRPQNNGYVDAVTGIRNLIQKFNDKKETLKSSTISKPANATQNKKQNNIAHKDNVSQINNNTAVYYNLIKNGEAASFSLKQNEFDSMISFNQNLPKFMADADFLLQNQINNLKKQINPKSPTPTVLKRGKNDVNSYFSQLFTYIQKHYVGVDGTYVHFRIKKGDSYHTLSEFGYPIEGLTTEPIPAYNSIIGLSVSLGLPIIQSYNNKLHKSTHPNETIKRNYITFTFKTISQYFNVDISMCISAVENSRSKCKNIFTSMALLRFDKVVEDYIIKYIDSCKKLHPDYNIANILNYGG